MVNHTQKAVDKLIINPSSMLTTAPNKNKYNKVKDRLNRNPQSQAGSSDFTHIPRHSIFKIFHQNIGGIRDKTNEFMNSLLPELPQILCITEHHRNET
jgi:hypothetical protein